MCTLRHILSSHAVTLVFTIHLYLFGYFIKVGGIRGNLIAVKANQRDLHDAVKRIEDCLLKVRERMDANYLKLNKMRKLKCFVSDRDNNSAIYTWCFERVWYHCYGAGCCKRPWLLWDSQMTIVNQISKLCKHLHCIFEISWKLENIYQRIDSNIAPLYSIPNCDLQKLQRLEGWAARVIMGGKKYDHVSPLTGKTALTALLWTESNSKFLSCATIA